MELKERIRKVRGELSQAKFAQSISVASSSLSDYETGNKKPGYEILLRIIKTYDIDPSWLLTGEATPQNSATTTADEMMILRRYRNTDKEGKQAIQRYAKLESDRIKKE